MTFFFDSQRFIFGQSFKVLEGNELTQETIKMALPRNYVFMLVLTVITSLEEEGTGRCGYLCVHLLWFHVFLLFLLVPEEGCDL